MNRPGRNGEGSKRRREASFVESVPVKKVKSRSPVKDDFYTRRVKDSDRRSSLGPKSPLMPASVLPVVGASPSTSTLVQGSSILGGSTRSSRSFSVASSGTVRPSPLSTSSSTVALPVVGDADQVPRGVHGQRSRDSGSRVPRSDAPPSGRSTPSVDAAEASVAEVGTGRSALSRYLAKATSQIPVQETTVSRQHSAIAADPSATRDIGDNAYPSPPLEKVATTPPIYPRLPRTMSTGLESVGVTGSTTTITTTSIAEASSWTAPVRASPPANRSILAMAGDALRDVSGALRRSLSRSSLSGNAIIPVKADTPTQARRQVEDGAKYSGKSTQDGTTERLSTKEAESEEGAQDHPCAPNQHGCSPNSATAAPGSNLPRDTTLEEAELGREAARLAGNETTPPADIDDCARPENEGSDDLANAIADSAASHLHQRHLGHARAAARVHAHIPGLPAPLTRPGRAFGTTTATRALQPRAHANIPASAPPSSLSSLPAVKPSTSARTISGAPTSLAARALARLPPPGSASAAALAQCKTSLKENERAKELAQKRARYEELARGLEESKKRRIEAVVPPRAIRALPLIAHPVNSGGASHNRRHAMPKAKGNQVEAEVPMTRTIPIAGATPGKASRARAQARADFEAGLRARQEEKERQEREVQRARQEMEEEEYRLQRMETVIRAHELPAIYSRRV